MSKKVNFPVKREPDPPFSDCDEWLPLAIGPYYLTAAYLRGARDAKIQRFNNPYYPGPAFAQYGYGYGNQAAGLHHPFPHLFDENPEYPVQF